MCSEPLAETGDPGVSWVGVVRQPVNSGPSVFSDTYRGKWKERGSWVPVVCLGMSPRTHSGCVKIYLFILRHLLPKQTILGSGLLHTNSVTYPSSGKTDVF